MTADRIGIDFLNCTEISAIQRAHVAADLGCRYFGVSLDAECGHEITDRSLRSELAAVMADRGVAISMVEGIAIAPGYDVADLAPKLDAVCELGAGAINVYSFESDYQRNLDQVGTFVDLVVSRGLQPVAEFVPCLPMKDLPSALKMLADLSRPELRLVVDFMHILRSGCSVAELAAVDPALIGYVQISDVPLTATVPNYGEESLHHRLPIGEGDVPVREFLGVLPRDLLIGIEAPMTDKARAGMDPRERLASSVAFVRRLLVEAGEGTPPAAALHKFHNEY